MNEQRDIESLKAENKALREWLIKAWIQYVPSNRLPASLWTAICEGHVSGGDSAADVIDMWLDEQFT